jgi:hypothetical protein
MVKFELDADDKKQYERVKYTKYCDDKAYYNQDVVEDSITLAYLECEINKNEILNQLTSHLNLTMGNLKDIIDYAQKLYDINLLENDAFATTDNEPDYDYNFILCDIDGNQN